jgi:hypothetical protein
MALILDGTNGLSDVDGSASTPAIRGTDTNTGIFFPAADTIAFAEGGAEVARIDSNGNLGIGTSSPSFKLQVNSVTTNGTSLQAGPCTLSGFSSQGFFAGAATLSSGGTWTATNTASAQIGILGSGAMTFSTNDSLTVGNTFTPTERMRIDSSGDLLVGVTSGDGRIRMKQSADAHTGTFVIENFGNTNTWSFLIGSDNNFYVGYNGSSRGQFNNSSGAYTALSDQRLKKNIASVSYGLDSVMSLNPVEYNMVDELDESQKHLGFIAQEASQVLPSTVSEFPDGTLGMDRTEIIPVLVKAIQEQQAIITDLKSRIEALEAK